MLCLQIQVQTAYNREEKPITNISTPLIIFFLHYSNIYFTKFEDFLPLYLTYPEENIEHNIRKFD